MASFKPRPILVIPALELSNGRCVLGPERDDQTIPLVDPVQMARLWRVQNASSLWIFDRDAEDATGTTNRSLVKEICEAVDIPVLVGGGLHEIHSIRQVLANGAYRAAVRLTQHSDFDLLGEAVDEFGGSRICGVIHIRQGHVMIGGQPATFKFLSEKLPDTHCYRLVCTVHDPDTDLPTFLEDIFKSLAESLGPVRVTVTGGVSGFLDLQAIQKLPSNVDSVIIGHALYEKRFPCQHFWCWNDLTKIDLLKFSTAQLRSDGTSS